jgi:hypothetical protein
VDSPQPDEGSARTRNGSPDPEGHAQNKINIYLQGFENLAGKKTKNKKTQNLRISGS